MDEQQEKYERALTAFLNAQRCYLITVAYCNEAIKEPWKFPNLDITTTIKRQLEQIWDCNTKLADLLGLNVRSHQDIIEKAQNDAIITALDISGFDLEKLSQL